MNKKININKVRIARIECLESFTLSKKTVYYNCIYPLWLATVYPYNSKIFYDLVSPEIKYSKYFGNMMVGGCTRINLDKSVFLSEILKSIGYKSSMFVNSEELLYITMPIMKTIEYMGKCENNIPPISSCINTQVYYVNSGKGKVINKLVFPRLHYAVDFATGNIISYDYICDEIPFIPKNNIKNIFNYEASEPKPSIKEFSKKLR